MADNYDISDDTQEYVNAIDQKIGDRYGVSLYNILNDSNALKGKDNAKQILIGMRADITEFFSSLTTKLKVEQEELENELKAADTLYNRINDLIKNKASFAGIPYVKPFGIERDTDNEENIVIDQFDNTCRHPYNQISGGGTLYCRHICAIQGIQPWNLALLWKQELPPHYKPSNQYPLQYRSWQKRNKLRARLD